MRLLKKVTAIFLIAGFIMYISAFAFVPTPESCDAAYKACLEAAESNPISLDAGIIEKAMCWVEWEGCRTAALVVPKF